MLMKRLLLTSLLLSFSAVASGAEPLTTSSEIIQKAKNECARFDGGEFHATNDAVTSYDFTGDGQPDEVVDASRFSCSTAASMWNGSGGTFLWVVVENKVYEFLAHKWRVVDLDDQRVLLLAVHSSECADTIGPCYRALVWQDGFRTTR